MTSATQLSARRRRKTESLPEALKRTKAGFALDAARAGNLLTGDKTHVLSARLNEALVSAAKERTGITSDTQLVELALASLAVGDDFGEWLVTQGGQLSADFANDF
jgi:hypothetical protein